MRTERTAFYHLIHLVLANFISFFYFLCVLTLTAIELQKLNQWQKLKRKIETKWNQKCRKCREKCQEQEQTECTEWMPKEITVYAILCQWHRKLYFEFFVLELDSLFFSARCESSHRVHRHTHTHTAHETRLDTKKKICGNHILLLLHRYFYRCHVYSTLPVTACPCSPFVCKNAICAGRTVISYRRKETLRSDFDVSILYKWTSFTLSLFQLFAYYSPLSQDVAFEFGKVKKRYAFKHTHHHRRTEVCKIFRCTSPRSHDSFLLARIKFGTGVVVDFTRKWNSVEFPYANTEYTHSISIPLLTYKYSTREQNLINN